MLELNITKNTDQTSQAKYGKYSARVEYKKTMSTKKSWNKSAWPK